jgi:phospholipid transport system substrate-binding protein
MNLRQREISIRAPHLIRVLSAAILITLLPVGAAADTPKETVAVTVDAVLHALRASDVSEEAKMRRVKSIISEHFDFRAMSSRVLATNWKKATKKQRNRFSRLFKELLSNTYWSKISGYKNETVAYVGESIRDENVATVKTLIKTESVDIPVDYKMYRKEDGKWYAYDVVIEQVSLVRNYRGSFQQVVRDSGIDGLIRQLETKVARSSLPARN